jgi:LmbE family N-acetylglucosaminyl deacetylase
MGDTNGRSADACATQEDVKGIVKYLNDFAETGGVFQYPKFETFDVSNNPRVLVLAPHPDDDVIGCGGTLAKCAQLGSHVKVVFMTDGRYGNSNIPMKALINLRKMEAKAALKVVGIEDAVFLDIPDMGLRCTRENVQKILRIVKEFQPTAIFVPSLWEVPPDHLTTAKIAAHVARKLDMDVDWYCYEVWCPVASTPRYSLVLVDITNEMELKKQAIAEHKSQVALNDYPTKIAGLNAYRSMYASKGVDYCEAFVLFDRPGFVEHARSFGFFEKKNGNGAKATESSTP